MDHAFDVIWCLGTFRGHDYRLLTVTFDFSNAFDKFKRAWNIIWIILLMLSHLHVSELCAEISNKLLRLMMTFEWVPLI